MKIMTMRVELWGERRDVEFWSPFDEYALIRLDARLVDTRTEAESGSWGLC
jgi:hypothetical protein